MSGGKLAEERKTTLQEFIYETDKNFVDLANGLSRLATLCCQDRENLRMVVDTIDKMAKLQERLVKEVFGREVIS